jgi:hypothetical protein
MNVIRFPLWLVERRGECVQGPPAPVIVLPVIRIERDHIGDAADMIENGKPTPKPRGKRRAKR